MRTLILLLLLCPAVMAEEETNFTSDINWESMVGICEYVTCGKEIFEVTIVGADNEVYFFNLEYYEATVTEDGITVSPKN